jgi:two-component sensor histidine kinase
MEAHTSLLLTFAETSPRTISIALNYMNDEQMLLEISDNASPNVGEFNLTPIAPISIELINLFAEQLEATLQLQIENGFELSLEFGPSIVDRAG